MALYGVLGPLVFVAVLSVASRLLGIVFGNAMFGITLVVGLAWRVFAGWGRRMDAARPTTELLRSSGTTYAREVASGDHEQLPLPARALTVATGTVAVGSLAVILTHIV